MYDVLGPTASIPALPEDSADKLVVRERLVEELDLKISPLRLFRSCRSGILQSAYLLHIRGPHACGCLSDAHARACSRMLALTMFVPLVL